MRFLLSLITKDNDYQLEQASSAQSAAQQAGVDLHIVYADNDAITQSTQLLRAVQCDPADRPKAIIVEPVGGTAFPQVAQAAVKANIGWAVLNREADYISALCQNTTIPVFSVSSDHKEIGRIQGRQFAALLPGGGGVLYIQGPSETSAAKDRTAGMQMSLPAAIHITSLRARWTEESAQRAIESWLRLSTSQKAQIDVVAAQNDQMALGARKAFEQVADLVEKERWMNRAIPGRGWRAQNGASLGSHRFADGNRDRAHTSWSGGDDAGRRVPEGNKTSRAFLHRSGVFSATRKIGRRKGEECPFRLRPLPSLMIR